MSTRIPADQGARDRIRADLDTNLLVEAGAGSGKTTMLVHRMVRLLSTGTVTVDRMAAVTFTRKAAGELSQRLQQELERLLGELSPGSPEAVRLRAALDALDQSFAGTIHSFCARLLRERPLEAGVDPGFRELMTAELMQMARRFWSGFLERRAGDGDPLLDEMERAGLRPARFRDLFFVMMDNLDVEFPTPDADPPDLVWVERIQRRLEELLDRGLANLPDSEPERGWDPLQAHLRELRFSRRFPGWEHPADFFSALARTCGRSGFRTTLKQWIDKGEAKAFKEAMEDFIDPEGPAARLLARWYAYRYPLIIRFVREAALEFRELRLRNGTLSFQDLLEGAAALLRAYPEARRDLGERFRRLLVDEFQDTDPIQAELLFLLASEPEEGGGSGGGKASREGEERLAGGEAGQPRGEEEVPSWAGAVPRPGALFVVGDPKQSIYRFRRADIALYGFVKDRFRRFGDVVSLTTNFRSTPAIADLVNGVFRSGDRFPEMETPAQASFAPLEPWQSELGPGARVYTVDGSNRDDLSLEDAERVASFVRAGVDAGRKPGDFLILTRYKQSLVRYARALEARNLPVQVTGAGVGVEEELRELVLLLRALVDPGDGVLTVGALTGLFVGLDHDHLLDFRMEGGSFDLRQTHPEEGTGAAVAAALNRLHLLWRRSRVEPADVFITSLAGEVGLIPWAAAGPLGSLRAGAMIYALDAVRRAASAGETSLPTALEALEAALEVEDAETPLEPLREEAVRLMNLHQAKGLEAPVVILAEPAGAKDPRVELYIERKGARALGWFSVEERGEGRYSRPVVVARPGVWAEKLEEAIGFAVAEETRLLYVAATRAREELLVSWNSATPEKSPWAGLGEWLANQGLRAQLALLPEPPREELEVNPSMLREEAEAGAQAIAVARAASYRISPVTLVTRGGGVVAGTPPEGGGGAAADPGAPRGPEWGSVVHAALALASRGLPPETLRRGFRTLLLEHERPVGPDGDPRELGELSLIVEGVRNSALWRRAMASPIRLVEAPFALPGDVVSAAGSGRGTPHPGSAPGESPGPSSGGGGGDRLPDVLEGVVDLAFREPDGWIIADYKTDVGDARSAPERLAGYRRQVELYATCWEHLTGEPVKERILFFTRSGTEMRW